MSDTKYDGIPVKLGDKEFIVPSLSVNAARKYWPNILDLNNGLTIDQFPSRLEFILNIVHAAISRNYPEMTVEELGELIDTKNAGEILMAVVEATGFIRSKRSRNEENVSGEPGPVEPPTLH